MKLILFNTFIFVILTKISTVVYTQTTEFVGDYSKRGAIKIIVILFLQLLTFRAYYLLKIKRGRTNFSILLIIKITDITLKVSPY